MKSQISKFTTAFRIEQAAGPFGPALVCVMGYEDLDVLMGELRAIIQEYGMHTVELPACEEKRCEFMGVRIFRSQSQAHGMIFGSDPE